MSAVDPLRTFAPWPYLPHGSKEEAAVVGPSEEELQILDTKVHGVTAHRLARYYVAKLDAWGPVKRQWIRAFDSSQKPPFYGHISLSIPSLPLAACDVQAACQGLILARLFTDDFILDGDQAHREYELVSQAGLSEKEAVFPFRNWLSR